MVIYLLQGLLLGFGAAASPGPFQAFLLSQTLKLGWQRSIWAAFAPIFSDGPIIALVLLILTQTPTGFLATIQVLGGFFILYLAKEALDVFLSPEITWQFDSESGQQSLFKAIVVNALNPNPYIFWGTVAAPILIAGWREHSVEPSGFALSVAFLLGFYGAIVGGFAALVMVFALARHLGPQVTRILNGISAVALLGFGLYQIWVGLSRF